VEKKKSLGYPSRGFNKLDSPHRKNSPEMGPKGDQKILRGAKFRERGWKGVLEYRGGKTIDPSFRGSKKN